MPEGRVPLPTPTMTWSPPTRSIAWPRSSVGCSPTMSKTAWAPSPPVSFRTSSTAFSSDRNAWCAPTSLASSSFASDRSRATTVAGLIARRIWMPTCPSPPAPLTTATDPGTSLGRDALIAWYGVRPASVSDACFTGSRPCRGPRGRGRLERVVRGQAVARELHVLHRVQTLQRHQVPGAVDDEVLRHRPGPAEPRRLDPEPGGVLAVVLLALGAEVAGAAPPRPVDR